MGAFSEEKVTFGCVLVCGYAEMQFSALRGGQFSRCIDGSPEWGWAEVAALNMCTDGGLSVFQLFLHGKHCRILHQGEHRGRCPNGHVARPEGEGGVLLADDERALVRCADNHVFFLSGLYFACKGTVF